MHIHKDQVETELLLVWISNYKTFKKFKHQYSGDEIEIEDREESPKPLGKIKDRRVIRTERFVILHLKDL